MTDDLSPPSYAGGEALLARLRSETCERPLAIDLAVALGVLIADQCHIQSAKPPLALALADIVMRAACNRRQTAILVSDCVGSA